MKQKKKIVYIEANRDGSIGGSYYSMLYLIEGLNKEKYEPHVIFYQNNPLIPDYKKSTPFVYVYDFHPYVSQPLKRLGDYIKWPYRFFVGIILKQLPIKKIINEIKPDLVHLNNGHDAMHEWVLACYFNKIKIVIHDRGTRPPYSLQTKLFVRLIDALICISDYYRQYITDYNLKIKRVVRIHNGLDFSKFDSQIDKQRIKNYLSKYNIDRTTNIVGIVGNIDYWKGQLVVLKAIKQVKQIQPDIKCLIIGSVVKGAEGYKNDLDDYIANNNLSKNVVFTGFIKDIPNILQVLDILIHASIEPEPFGRVMLEGMAAKKPIIATNAGGIPEIINDMESGILVPMGDDDSMAEAIKYFVSNKDVANEMADKANNRLITAFGTEKMVKDTENLYSDIFQDK